MQESVKPKLGFGNLNFFKNYAMTKIEEKIVQWEKAKVAYDVWLETLAFKHRSGTTIYTQLQQLLSSIVDDLKSLNEETAKDLPDEKKVCINHKMITAPGLGEYCEICGYGLDDL